MTSRPPPATGKYAYNGFVPPSAGGAYADPVFLANVRRLTGDHAHDDLYARNMCWNADGTRYVHRTNGVPGKADAWDVIEVATGRVTHKAIPFGSIAADGGFDPVDPDALLAFAGSQVYRYTLLDGGAWSDDIELYAPDTLLELGGSINWLDASGRYMLLRYGSEPSVHLYDRHDIARPYGNPIDARNTIGAGSYLGLSPDGNYVVGYDSRKIGASSVGQGVSWRIDHERRQLAPTPTAFWSLCGDHGAYLSASDGRTYFITYNCYGHAGLWRVDVTNNAEQLDEAAQMALPNNRELLRFATWNDFGHVTTVARGAWRDWAFVSTEDSTDAAGEGIPDPNGNIEPWHAYRQEIFAVNVLTGELRRLAHHRSRSMDYYSQPRVSASWDGTVVGFASNMNTPGVVDTYAIGFASGGTPTPEPPPPDAEPIPITVTLGARTFTGTVEEE